MADMQKILKYLDELTQRYPDLEGCAPDIEKAYRIMEESFAEGNKLLLAGNGGSAADSEHIVGELMKSFCQPRPCPASVREKLTDVSGEFGPEIADTLEQPLPAIALTGAPSLTSAFSNDRDPKFAFAQQVYGYGRPGDVLLGISTSGNSRNILYAAITAKALGLKVIGLTGNEGGDLGGIADAVIRVPCTETYKAQERHLPVYHCLCLMLEERFFGC